MSWSAHMTKCLYRAKGFTFDLRSSLRRYWCWYIVPDLDEMRQGTKMFPRHPHDLAVENLDGILLACDVGHKKGAGLHRTATHVVRASKELAQSRNCVCFGFHEADPDAPGTADRLGDRR